MKRFIFFIIIFLSPAIYVAAQNDKGNYVVKDSIVYRKAADMDSSLTGKSVFNLLSSGGSADVRIHQSQAILDAVKRQILNNSDRNIQGYRVRIFFDNRQDSRQASEAAMERFNAEHHGIAAYRSFQSPFFKVTVGDFRTRSEAVELLEKIISDFPSAFVVREKINYPVVDINESYTVDTVKVVKRL